MTLGKIEYGIFSDEDKHSLDAVSHAIKKGII
ncbi:MAG: hypothetical protein ACI9LG_002226 [Moritella dasanensis]|jgi:hypothetical protein